MKYHVIIKDNETGNICLEKDVIAILGAVADGEQTIRLLFAECEERDILETVDAVREEIIYALESLDQGKQCVCK